MMRKRTIGKSKARALAAFRNLTKADTLLFCVIEMFRGMDLDEFVGPLEGVRAKLAGKLEACQDEAYVSMDFRKTGPAKRHRTAKTRRKRLPSGN